MLYALEIRLPFLNHNVVDSILKSPTSSSLLMGDKFQLRKYAHEFLKLPLKITQKKKLPFFTPNEFCTSTKYTNYLKSMLTRKHINKFQILNYDYIDSLLNNTQPDFLLTKKLNAIIIFQKPDKKMTIIGAIIGDVMGSVYEFDNIRTTEFDMFHPNCDFTDDTVLTIAVADCVLHNKDLAKTIWEYGRAYPNRGYGGRFYDWLQQDQPQPYGSFGNGSAMRVSAVGFAYDDMETVLEVAKQTAVVTHNHPEGVKGAQATAAAIFMARQGITKQEMKDFLSQQFNYDLDFTLDAIRPTYEFDETCQGTVPQAIVAFLESIDFEHAIRLAISIGGDSDTIACITGGIAAAYYKQIPVAMIEFALKKLPAEFIEIINEFEAGRNGTRSK